MALSWITNKSPFRSTMLQQAHLAHLVIPPGLPIYTY